MSDRFTCSSTWHLLPIGDPALLAVIPLRPAEIRLKVDQGTSALIEAFDRVGINELVDPRRPSSV